MTDVRGLVLQKILNNEEGSLESWSKLKLGYFGPEYAAIYRALAKFYLTHSSLPSFQDLEIHNRNPILKISLEALRLADSIDVDLDLAVEALVNEYTQEETLNELDGFIDEITYYTASEIKENLGTILLNIEEKTLSAEEIVFMNQISFVTEPELLNLMPLGLNNTFDAEVGGMAPTEALFIGGVRGTGKSNVCCNLSVNQYEAGNTSLYFTIEMRAQEIFNRKMALLSGVSLSHITKASLTGQELRKIAKARANMFEDADDIYSTYIEDKDFRRFEHQLIQSRELKKDNQLIIVDAPHLTLTSIDLTIQKFKAQFGDKLKLVVVDYLNQISIENKYDWKVQIEISAKLKEFARKYDLILAAPYQIDNTGEARFSKGILDSADIAMILEREEGSGRMDFKSTKTRNMGKFEFASPFNESTLRIDCNDSRLPSKETVETPKKEPKEKSKDLPW